MTKREFLDIVFALAPNEANAIMDAFDEYVDSNEPHWIPVTEQRTGKWIEYEQKFMTDRPFETIKKHVRECSLCRTKIAGFDGTMRYCPNCGAKMEVTT